jgi:hypothetical protein
MKVHSEKKKKKLHYGLLKKLKRGKYNHLFESVFSATRYVINKTLVERVI